jgi:hypothetical protein
MVLHKFKVGQSLVYLPRRLGSQVGKQTCQIVRLMPVEVGEPQYRIKCTNENFERIAKESQLDR